VNDDPLPLRILELRAFRVSADVRFGAHFGLKSDITALPKRADAVEKVFYG